MVSQERMAATGGIGLEPYSPQRVDDSGRPVGRGHYADDPSMNMTYLGTNIPLPSRPMDVAVAHLNATMDAQFCRTPAQMYVGVTPDATGAEKRATGSDESDNEPPPLYERSGDDQGRRLQ